MTPAQLKKKVNDINERLDVILLQDLKKEFLKACIYVKKVPFYGVIGKPEED